MSEPYFQSSNFTCGPASLMMAMHRLDKSRSLDRLEEYLIWREANSIFMGHRHAGCTQYGLALAATRRGFGAEIFSNNISNFDRHFENCVLSMREKEVFNLVHRHDKEKARKDGIAITKAGYSRDFIKELLEQKRQIILLVRSFNDDEEHWVLLSRAGEQTVSLLDPYRDNLADRAALDITKGATHRIDYERFERRCFFGKNKDYLMIALAK